ncbi:MAG: adenylate/guanylate cyclase domain-containing protein [Gammaproteobacteria bacterium]
MTEENNTVSTPVVDRIHALKTAVVCCFLSVDEKFQSFWSSVCATAAEHRQALKTWIPETLVVLRRKAHRIPLVYKLSLLITILVVICMGLLGSIIIQQQSRLFEEQLVEQGTSLARLMAQSTKEPLLAEDQLALDVVTTSFSRSDSVTGTAIITLEGETISHVGRYHDGANRFQARILKQLMGAAPGSMAWQLPAAGRYSPPQFISFVQPVLFQDVIVGYTMVTLSKADMTKSLKQSIQAIIGATVLIILLGIAMAIALGRRISEPIDQLVDASRAIGKGEYKIQFKERRGDELGMLMSAFNEMAEGLLEKSQLRDALSRYVSRGVATEIFANLNDVELSGKRIDGSVIFADIVGFTRIAENIKPEELVTILNKYFSLITRACELNYGNVDKYMGDGIMLVFGAPQPDAEHPFHALCCALLIQRLIEHENRQREQQGLFPVRFRIGINSGTMLAGNMGSRERMEYTVVGDTVNLASRLCSISESGQIVVSRDMYFRDGVSERVVAGEHQSIRLRGITQPVTTYLVEGMAAAWQGLMNDQFEQLTQIEADEQTESQTG